MKDYPEPANMELDDLELETISAGAGSKAGRNRAPATTAKNTRGSYGPSSGASSGRASYGSFMRTGSLPSQAPPTGVRTGGGCVGCGN